VFRSLAAGVLNGNPRENDAGLPVKTLDDLVQRRASLALAAGASISAPAIPDEFDSASNWPMCPILLEIRDQSACGSCYAVSAASTATDRFCIYHNGARTAIPPTRSPFFFRRPPARPRPKPPPDAPGLAAACVATCCNASICPRDQVGPAVGGRPHELLLHVQGWERRLLRRHALALLGLHGAGCSRTRPHVPWERASPLPHPHQDWAHPCHIHTRTELTLPHLRRDLAHPCHICTGAGLTPATSAPGLSSPLPHLRRD
jgi:hypothetical protein